MKPVAYVLAEDETGSWRLVFHWDRRLIYVGTGRPPYKRTSIDEMLGKEPHAPLQRQARDKLMSLILDAICFC